MKRDAHVRAPRASAGEFLSSAGNSVTHWLLEGPAQLRSGLHTGAVAGMLEADGRAAYAYPEITGYYLQWLAWRAAIGDAAPPLARRAAAAQSWIAAWLESHDPPPTRIPLAAVVPDWRNDASFFFDLAMVLRGLGSAVRHSLIAPDPGVVAGLSRELARLIGSDGAFMACLPRAGAPPLPDRWSTRRGGFLAKAAAGVITAARVLPGIPSGLVAAAEATFGASLEAALDAPHDEAHPLLYTFEGVLGLPRHPRFRAVLPAVAAQFDALLEDVRTSGWIRESRAERGPQRLDVAAQAIRVGRLLAAHLGSRRPDRVPLARLERLLAETIRPDGAVPFAMEQSPSRANVWAAMFADQALGMNGAPSWPALRDPLLV